MLKSEMIQLIYSSGMGDGAFKMLNKKDPIDIYIKITKDGPYLVFGKPEIKEEIIEPNEQGNSWEYVEGQLFKTTDTPTALCRCGKSKNKPFCDGSHVHGFDGTETASHEPILDKADSYEGPNYTLYDNEVYCAFARFCDAFGQVWNLVQNGDGLSDKLALHEAEHCPAGRLMMKDNKTGEFIEPTFTKSIGLLQDPQIGCSGPLYVKGKIKVIGADGQSYEVRNRQTLCRCGKSSNKPFCDGTHASLHFDDGLAEKRQRRSPKKNQS